MKDMKKMRPTIIVWLFFFVKGGFCLCETDSLEPCLFKNSRDLPYSVYTRHPSIGYSAETDDTKFCDLFALNHGEWYRSSYNMTNYCVDHRKCGTNDPIYLNGSIPNPDDGVVDAKACVRTFGNCCEHTLNMRMKNCHFFMVYCFLDLHPSCHSRFCFDVDLSVETTTTSSSTTSTTTSTTPSTRQTTPSTRPTTPSTAQRPCKTETFNSYRFGQDNELGIYKGLTGSLAVLLTMCVMGLLYASFSLYRIKGKQPMNLHLSGRINPEVVGDLQKPPPYETCKKDKTAL